MKNVILCLTIALLVLNGSAFAQQIVTQQGDTAFSCWISGTDVAVYNRVKSGTSNNVVLKWNVVYRSFDNGFDETASGICDNNQCYYASSSNNFFANGNIFYSYPYNSSGFGDFHVLFGLSGTPTVGAMAVARINAYDTVSHTTRTLTFIAKKCALGISSVSSTDEIVLYPNPARDAINVIYDASAGIKTMAVYNIIGKLMGPIYKPSSSNSAKIDLDDMPTGIYFLRLMDGQGRVIATRRFTRQ
jgi:hypothetical protein